MRALEGWGSSRGGQRDPDRCGGAGDEWVDRRLLVAVAGFSLNEAAAEDALQSGANINLQDAANRNDTLLIMALRQFVEPRVIRWILDKGGDPRIANSERRSALSVAIQLYSGSSNAVHAEILKMLRAAPAAAPQEGAPPAGAAAPGAAPEGNAAPVPATAQNSGEAPAQPGIDPITGRGFAEPLRASGATGGPPPQPGVYECINQQAARTPMMFAILDGSTYMASTGRTGRYTYDSGSGLLSLIQGGETARFQRTGPTLFRPINPATGRTGGLTCPLNRKLDPRHPRRW